jgi:hypothetical protein
LEGHIIVAQHGYVSHLYQPPSPLYVGQVAIDVTCRFFGGIPGIFVPAMQTRALPVQELVYPAIHALARISHSLLAHPFRPQQMVQVVGATSFLQVGS